MRVVSMVHGEPVELKQLLLCNIEQMHKKFPGYLGIPAFYARTMEDIIVCWPIPMTPEMTPRRID